MTKHYHIGIVSCEKMLWYTGNEKACYTVDHSDALEFPSRKMARPPKSRLEVVFDQSHQIVKHRE